MKLVNAGLKSEREMVIFLAGGENLYYEPTMARLYFDINAIKEDGSCFFVKPKEAGAEPIDGYWDFFSVMSREITLKDAIKSGKKVPCWTDDSKIYACLIIGLDDDGIMFRNSEGEHFPFPIPIESDELL